MLLLSSFTELLTVSDLAVVDSRLAAVLETNAVTV
jgi:hypothetical protein